MISRIRQEIKLNQSHTHRLTYICISILMLKLFDNTCLQLRWKKIAETAKKSLTNNLTTFEIMIFHKLEVLKLISLQKQHRRY